MADNAEKLSITLTPQLAARVRSEVDAGSYGSVSEVIREALRDWQNKLDEREAQLEEIRDRVRRSIEDPRPRVPLSEMRERIKQRHEEAMKASRDDAA